MFSDHVKILVDGAFFSLNMQVIFYNVLVMKPLENMNTTSILVSLESKGVLYEFSMDSFGFWGLIWAFLGVIRGFSGAFLGLFRGFSMTFLGVLGGFSEFFHGFYGGFTWLLQRFSGDFLGGFPGLFQGFFGLWLQVTN